MSSHTQQVNKKNRVGILFGGRSAEHEVSLLSAKNVIAALDRDRFEPVLIGIDKNGGWHLHEEASFLLNATDPKLISLNKAADDLAIVPGNATSQLIGMNLKKPLGMVDVVFPVLHGTFGEDGTVQGLLKLLDIPFVGPSILGSAVGMDKDVMKRLLRDAGLPIGKFLVLHREVSNQPSYEAVAKELGEVVFVKPANAGSSVGVSKAKNASEFNKAVHEAFIFDRKILVEEYIKGREIECAVLGNSDPKASIPGEIIPTHEFYSYEAKYIDENGAAAEIPAKLSAAATKKVQELSIKTFKALDCEGMGRVDCFVTEDEKIYINEINTIPGFTKISMYPKLWEASGLSYDKLITRLIEYAFERFQEEKKSKTSFS